MIDRDAEVNQIVAEAVFGATKRYQTAMNAIWTESRREILKLASELMPLDYGGIADFSLAERNALAILAAARRALEPAVEERDEWRRDHIKSDHDAGLLEPSVTEEGGEL